MSVVTSRKIVDIARSSNPKVDILNQVGDLTNEDVLCDLVLVGVYIRPEKTAGGIIRPQSNLDEDSYQGKVGLVLKKGPIAWGEWEEDSDRGKSAEVGDWVIFSVKDGWQIMMNGYPCRLIPYERLRMRVSNPEKVF